MEYQRSTPVRTIGLGLLLLLVTLVITQEAHPQAPVATTDDAPAVAGLLAGPKVPESALQQSGTGGNNNRPRQPAQSMQVWIEALEAVSPTVNQRAHISAIVSSFRRHQREFRLNYVEELRELRGARLRARGRGEALDPEMLDRIRDLESRSPRIKQYQLQIWTVLVDRQQDRIRTELARLRARE